MSKPAPFGVTVTDRQPGITAVIAPERSVGSGRYGGPCALATRTQQDRTHRRPRRRPRLRPRLHVPVVAAVGVATGVVVAGAVAMAQMGGSSNDAGRPPATVLETVAGAAAAGSPSGAGGAARRPPWRRPAWRRPASRRPLPPPSPPPRRCRREQALLLESVGGTFDVTRVVTRTNVVLPPDRYDRPPEDQPRSILCRWGLRVEQRRQAVADRRCGRHVQLQGNRRRTVHDRSVHLKVIDSWKIVLRVSNAMRQGERHACTARRRSRSPTWPAVRTSRCHRSPSRSTA